MKELVVLQEGQRWVAIDKPAGIGVEKHFNYDTVEKRALEQFKRVAATKLPFIGIVHRLDRPVSGVLLLARNKSTLVALNELFAKRQIQKIYWAVVETKPTDNSGRLKHYLLRDKFNRKAIAAKRPLPNAKEALLEYRVIDTYEKGCLLEIKPITGKFHQIRVQLATAGMPIIGDGLYGSTVPFEHDKIALHARSIQFQNPLDKKPTFVTAPLPDYWQYPNAD